MDAIRDALAAIVARYDIPAGYGTREQAHKDNDMHALMEEGWVVYCSLIQEPRLHFEPTHWQTLPAPPLESELRAPQPKEPT